jgi:hypothetical protein
MTEYKDKLSSFASRLKTENTQIPIQEVRPIPSITEIKEPETQLNIWIPKSLMKKLKKFSIDNELSIKEAVINSINKNIENTEENN